MAEFKVNEPTTVWVCPLVNGSQFAQAQTRIVFEVDKDGTNIVFLEELNLVNNVETGSVWINIRESERGPLLFSYNANLRIAKGDILYVRPDCTEEQWRFAHHMPYVDQSKAIPAMPGTDPLLRLDPNSREFLQALHAAYAEGLTNFGNFMKGIKEFSMPSNTSDSPAEINPTDEQRAEKINNAAEYFNRLVQEAAAAGLRTDIDLFPINRIGTQPYSVVKTEVVRIIGKAPEQGKVINNG